MKHLKPLVCFLSHCVNFKVSGQKSFHSLHSWESGRQWERGAEAPPQVNRCRYNLALLQPLSRIAMGYGNKKDHSTTRQNMQQWPFLLRTESYAIFSRSYLPGAARILHGFFKHSFERSKRHPRRDWLLCPDTKTWKSNLRFSSCYKLMTCDFVMAK